MRKRIIIFSAFIFSALLLFAGITQASDDIILSDDLSDFVLLSEAVPDAILEIRYYSTYNFVGDRIDGYEEPLAFLTKEAAAALKEVSDDLIGQGYRLKIYDAYRPQMAVINFVEWAQDPDDTRMKQYFYPELDKDALFPQGYIMEHSGHSRGSTVDLTLFDMNTEKEVDMTGNVSIETVSTNDFTMKYCKFGTGEKTFVILPGLSIQSVLDSADLIAEAYQLFAKDFTVYVFDRREELPASYSVYEMAQDTAAACQTLGMEDINLFGASYGGMAAMEIAIQYPELIEKVVLVSTSAAVTEDEYQTI
ncbi:MAG: alpha/beta fold hydrolase [Parasporobacterium sp.]|nr:alpha/beta fold hydrolase [Parasporobacterium sp.]